MKTRASRGMVEFVRTPGERRDAAIRDHVLDLLEDLDRRVRRIEGALDITAGAGEFERLMRKARAGESGGRGRGRAASRPSG